MEGGASIPPPVPASQHSASLKPPPLVPIEPAPAESLSPFPQSVDELYDLFRSRTLAPTLNADVINAAVGTDPYLGNAARHVHTLVHSGEKAHTLGQFFSWKFRSIAQDRARREARKEEVLRALRSEPSPPTALPLLASSSSAPPESSAKRRRLDERQRLADIVERHQERMLAQIDALRAEVTTQCRRLAADIAAALCD